MSDPHDEPPPLLPPPGPPPRRKSTWRELLIGTAMAVAVCLLLLPSGQIFWALAVLPVLALILAMFPATRGYGIGILITYGLAWVVFLAVCGGAILMMKR